jgi:hypothetical protein
MSGVGAWALTFPRTKHSNYPSIHHKQAIHHSTGVTAIIATFAAKAEAY